MKKLKPYAKAIVALAFLLVFALGSALGVDTGIDPEAQAQAILMVILTSAGVYVVPNKAEDE